MSKEARNTAVRTEASRTLREIAQVLRDESKLPTLRVADALAILSRGGKRIATQQRIADAPPRVPTAIRRELERAAADLEKRAARIKAVPVTNTERALTKAGKR